MVGGLGLPVAVGVADAEAVPVPLPLRECVPERLGARVSVRVGEALGLPVAEALRVAVVPVRVDVREPLPSVAVRVWVWVGDCVTDRVREDREAEGEREALGVNEGL